MIIRKMGKSQVIILDIRSITRTHLEQFVRKCRKQGINLGKFSYMFSFIKINIFTLNIIIEEDRK